MRTSHRLGSGLVAAALAMVAGCRAESGVQPQAPETSSSYLTSATTAMPLGNTEARKDIVDTAVPAGNFMTLVSALHATGLEDTLKGPGPFTVFAPTDEAFSKIPRADLDALIADKTKLAKVLSYHVISGNVPIAQAAQLATAKTLEGESIAIYPYRYTLMVEDAHIVRPDIAATNGTIHAIDTVLIPKTMMSR